ncbi:MAG: hypothetical protein RL217_982 [Pseudomonadota bacterium]|jgi:hypothetical protein
MSIQSEVRTPFYKEPIAWLLFLMPASAVVWSFVLLFAALDGQDSLVSDSYYKDGVSYTENQAIDHKAKEAHIRTELSFTDSEVLVRLHSRLKEEPNSLQLKLIHPTLQNEDVEVFLQRMNAGEYKGVMEQAHLGRRLVWLQSPEQQWRVRSEAMIDAGQSLSLNAQ